MKAIFCVLRPLAAAIPLAFCGVSSGDFTYVSVEDISGPPGLQVLRFYANFSNPQDTLVAVGGVPGITPVNFCILHGGISLFNDDGPFSGTKMADFPNYPIGGEFDRWVSINHTIFGGDTDYTRDFAGVPTDEQAIVGTEWGEEDGSWFDSDPDTPEQGTAMVIAQMTLNYDPVPGEPSPSLSAAWHFIGVVQWIPAGQTEMMFSVFIAPAPAPGALGVLALAGLATTRRRRT